MADYAKEREIAIEAVRRASLITQKVLQTSISSLTKSDKSPVTVGDFSAQAIVNAILAKYFPDDQIVGEEDSKDLQESGAESLRHKVIGLANEGLTQAGPLAFAQPLSEDQVLQAIDRGNSAGGIKGRMWTLDPIDGTKGFLRGGQYAVCLALIVDGEVRLGVMGCPNLPVDKSAAKPQEGNIEEVKTRDDLGVIFVASEGRGAHQRSFKDDGLTSISMRDITSQSLSKASFCESVEAGHSSQGTNARIAELLGISSPSVRMDSQAKYASVARGDGDIYLRLPVGDGSYQEKIWDHAAGALLVAEAGGRVSDAKGRPLDFSVGRTLKNNKGVVASHASIHEKVIEAVRAALEEEGRGHL
jgi:3'(2'), 5'-bisphosphate nucleotidase